MDPKKEPLQASLPMSIVCPFCGKSVTTEITATPGLFSWLICSGLFMVGCVMGCCLIPFCLKSLKDVTHTCPECHKEVYRFHRL